MSNQIVPTPREFLAALSRRFGPITFDLAANADNAVAARWFGPGSDVVDAFEPKDWPRDGLAFCNPPFGNIARFAQRCAIERAKGARIALIGPAAVCTGWFVDHVAPHAYVFELTPRVFKKEIRDCVIALYEPAGYVGRESWRWKP